MSIVQIPLRRARTLAIAALAAAPVLVALATAHPVLAAGVAGQQPTGIDVLAGMPGGSSVATRDECAAPVPGQASCMAVGVVSARTGALLSVSPQRSSGAPLVVTGRLEGAPPGLNSEASPSQLLGPASEPAATPAPGPGTPLYLQQAYDLTALSASAGSGTTVAIVDAYNDPSAAADLAYYRSYYGLPACTVASGCLRIVGENGSSTLPGEINSSWQTEESLDLDAVSALCPNCRLLLVEANSPTWSDLDQAEAAAVGAGATIVSDSWAGNGPLSTVPAPSDYSYPGVAIVAASGDYGWDGGDDNTAWPAALASVTAVGGTTLNASDTARGFTETAWSGAGSGCSAEAKPSYQTDSGCAGRSYTDISADADPESGLAVYDSAGGGWSVWGGTSLATPLTAAFYALVGNDAGQGNAAWDYAHSSLLNDPSSGSNDGGAACTPTYICAAGLGYDGPTGTGSIAGDVVAGAPGIGGPTGDDGYLSAQSATTATLSAGIWPNDEATSYYVEYGTTTGYGQTSASSSAGSGPGVVNVSATLSGLVPGTDYHYRLVAVNALGTTYGYDETIVGGAPIVTITSQPPASSTATSGAVDYAESAGVSSTACTLDGAAIPCSTSSATLTDLSVGAHTFVVSVTGAGGTGSATASFDVVAPPAPTVTITVAPADGSTSTQATVSYAESGATTSTACTLDGTAVSACTASSASLTNLTVGAHTFTVEVVGPGGTGTASATFSVAAAPAPSQPVASPSDPATPAPILGGTLITTPVAAVWTQVSVVPLSSSACAARASGCTVLRAALRFDLAEKARVTIGLYRETNGARRLVATTTVTAAAGENHLALGALFEGRTVAPGSYTLTAYATADRAAGGTRRVSTVFRANLRVG